jgi:AAT family amino acid transporter
MEKTVARFGYWGNVVIQFVLLYVISVVVYWLFVDPEIGVFCKTYPQPWFVWFFWFILVLAWFGFGGDMWVFHKLKQPMQGIVATITTGVVAAVMVWIITVGWGSIDPTFAWDRPDEMGKTAAGFFVLFGFVFFNHWFLNWQGWPWVDAGLKQPWLGLIYWMTGWIVTGVFYMFLLYPIFAPWAAKAAPMSLTTTAGWFYACLMIFLYMFINDNWPFSAFKERWKMAVSSFFGLFFFGTILYFLNLWLLKAILLPEAVQQAIGEENLGIWVAQYEVFWATYVIFWGLQVEGPYPTHLSPGKNRLVRFLIGIPFATIHFYVYHYWVARYLLHEPEVGGGFYGNALGFLDWYILVNLVYVVFFGNPGFVKTIKQENPVQAGEKEMWWLPDEA